MILINLLPHREERRKRRKAAFFVGLGVSAAFGLLVVGAWYAVLMQMTSAQQQRNDYLTSEIARLDNDIREIATLRADIEALRARQGAVENLQTDRNVPVYLLNDLVRQTPEGIYLTSIKQVDAVVSVNGVAQTQERVSELLRNTANSAQWLERPELVEIKTATPPPGQTAQQRADSKRLFEFSMRVTLKRPAGPAAAASGAPAAPAKKV